VKCRETASVGQPNYSSPAAHSKPSEERTEKNKRKGGKNPGDRGRMSRKTRGENPKKKPLEKEESPGNKHTERTRE
jgi:hypothetical protein